MAEESNVTNETILKHYRDAVLAKQKADEYHGIYMAKIKAAKSDGVNVKQLKEIIKERRPDPDVVEQEERDRVRYRALFNLPMVQMDLELEPVEMPDEQRVFEAGELGYAAGLRGDPADDNAGFVPGTDMYVRFRERWHEGAAARARKNKPGVTDAPTGKRKRKSKEADAPAGTPDTSSVH
jgi:hypothetical protein